MIGFNLRLNYKVKFLVENFHIIGCDLPQESLSIVFDFRELIFQIVHML